MKRNRNLVSLAIPIIIGILVSSSSAQTVPAEPPTPPVVKQCADCVSLLFQDIEVDDLVGRLLQDTDYVVDDISVLKGAKWTGEIRDTPRLKALEILVTSQGYSMSVVGKTITFTAVSDAAIRRMIRAKYADQADPATGNLPVDVQNAIDREVYYAIQARDTSRRQQAMASVTAASSAASYQGGNLQVDVQNAMDRANYWAMGGVYGGSFDQRYYWWWFIDHDRCVNNPQHRDCRMGKLKLNGEGAHFLSEFLRASFGGNGLLSKVDIYVQPILPDGSDGPVDNLGPASKRNNIFNKALRLPVGRYRVKFVLVERNLLLYDQPTQVWSEWDTKGEPTILQVDSNHFRNAPFLVDVERDRQSKKAAEVLK